MVEGGGRYVDAAVQAAGVVADEQAGALAAQRLTPREREILELIARGSITDDVARQLALSPSTVKAHLRSAYAKLGVSNRAAAIALLTGFVPLS